MLTLPDPSEWLNELGHNITWRHGPLEYRSEMLGVHLNLSLPMQLFEHLTIIF